MLAPFLVERLVEQKVQFDVCAWLPKVFYGVEDLEFDADVLFGALREEDGSPHIGRHNFSQQRSGV